ncbi:hypothetical protein ACQKEI_05340 [Psychrobacter namhaensis]|uniref:hypothetical protein n=1 Tax=Psychrobacter namhaensis TaxID=292734 RepID=UPI003D024917
MNNLPLRDLVWFEQPESFIDGQMVLTAQGAGIIYRMMQTQHCVVVTWHNQVKGTTGANESYKTFNEAQAFVSNTHYPHFMGEFVLSDSITDIANWFKAAKPEPTDKDKTTQLGCVVEEFAELMESVGFEGTARELQGIADELKGFTPKYATKFVERINKIDSLDATSDITVTVQGFNQLMGFNGLGAQREVIRSNNSKMVKGRFEYDENGKIMKPDSYSKPDLTPFVKQGE